MDIEEPVIVAEGVTLGYGRRVILSDVELKIGEGEFWSLLGPNGEGKTTFIKALLGAIKPLHGRILYRKDFARRTRLGFVPQESELNPMCPTTVKEFIYTGLVGIRVDRKQSMKRVLKVMDLLGLSKCAMRDLWELSGGQRQRAMVARALVRDPLVLIVDEPTSGLDMSAAESVLETMKLLSEEHKITIVYVTHDLKTAIEHSTHAGLFRNGRIISGNLKDVINNKNMTDTFGLPISIQSDLEGNPLSYSLVPYRERNGIQGHSGVII